MKTTIVHVCEVSLCVDSVGYSVLLYSAVVMRTTSKAVYPT